MRVKTLKNLDLLLHWGLGKQNTTYPLAHPPEEELLSIPLLELTNFSHDYGYFSLTRPLVGEVSSSKKDLEIALDILHSLYKNQVKGSTLQLATAEILTKIIAYRDLQLGQTLSIPFQTDTQLALETFTVDHIFDIWNGMPAFGLTSPHSSLLLFRGTDFSHLNKRAIASLLSDLDLAGPGLQAFNNARPTLHSWLKQMHSQGKPAQVMGFSLGGALAAYTYIYEHPLLSSSPSISICAPGVTPAVAQHYTQLHPITPFISYINAGDPISKVGTLFGTVYCLSAPTPLKPLSAHTALMCATPLVHKTRVLTAPPPSK